ncbi:hypothetical protein HC031_22295 [Planosporangium thailandense]|uniref:DUF5667 domain-containing protein n=1 Tax=Planosporangium thailandense TaxID=765197 RepID=A0ABX0Y2T1_9ACTN|nr:hypothetical protein [Planosporangium thailandense]NJC72427.1 hypothetical protein [Planosporangium thailandense]
MHKRRQGRIGLAEADRLVAGAPQPPEQCGLSVLLTAAAAAPFPEELADERAAVAGFARARREAGPATFPAVAVAPVKTRRIPLPRTAVVKVAVGLAVATTGGTAFAAAATTGSLPTGIQEQAHHLLAPLGVPAPSTATRPPSTRPHTGASAGADSGPAGTSPAPGGVVRSGDPRSPQAAELCTAWEAAQQRQHGKPFTPPQRRALAAVAGGEQNIPAFCADVSGDQPGQGSSPGTPTPRPDAPTAGRTHPGGGEGNKNGGGNKKGNGHPSGKPAKSHDPHPKG